MKLPTVAAVALGLTLLGLAGCSVNPATGTPNLVFMSESKEISLGKEMHEKILQSAPVYPDEELTAYINAIGQKLVQSSHRPELEYHFTIIDSPDINAFALPGGYVYINRGLIGYLQSEAQLAAVLAHEIGHITARHSVKQDTARKGSGVATIVSVLATGSTVVGDVADLWGTAAVSGYGREMELEADSLGAEYLYRAGYNPKAMIEVIGVLKDQERFSRRLALDSGKKPSSYHGVFATHPRNDKRLQEVVGKAGELSALQSGTDNREEFRRHTEDMVYGPNYQAKTLEAAQKNTYSHSKLGFSIDFPLQWQAENQRNQIVASAPDQHARMTIGIDLLRAPLAPNEYIQQILKIPTLQQSEPFTQFGMPGHMGLVPATASEPYPTRLAVIYQGSRVYIIKGLVEGPAAPPAGDSSDSEPAADSSEPKTDDQLFVDSIRTFRPSQTERRSSGTNKTLHYVRANEFTTFAQLAQHFNLGKYTEEQLRLLNGYYPRGEPQPGEWIKVVK
ncbi:MAG: M48 family metalloprotease [Gammaproteobacteria bacterium]|uniref:M48 family metalloprotease n=1 Tax=Pseudomaricurvus alcaniphilus TaxID=1166482 RepID=UPI00140A9E6C|nr:M48 family metalloprotease [Pseudomaricurvus alcaniphilus]MBR9910992.1 M48 family metalloprotease [Gammaproteobacteria bacterium]NHN37702.1 M48 family metalloprotease [Pseudomaricurvus alcaniphilus]